MHQPSRTSLAFGPSVISDCMQHAQAIAAILAPYLTTLTTEERRELPKVSDKTISFMTKLAEYMTTAPDFIPAYLDEAEFRRDLVVPAQLQPLAGLIEQISQNIIDTSILTGSEAYVAALMYYANVREAARRGLPNAKPVYEDLSARYPGRSANKEVTKAG